MLIPSKDVKYEKTKYKYTKYFGQEYSTVDIIAYILYNILPIYIYMDACIV